MVGFGYDAMLSGFIFILFLNTKFNASLVAKTYSQYYWHHYWTG